MLDILVHKI